MGGGALEGYGGPDEQGSGLHMSGQGVASTYLFYACELLGLCTGECKKLAPPPSEPSASLHAGNSRVRRFSNDEWWYPVPINHDAGVPLEETAGTHHHTHCGLL